MQDMSLACRTMPVNVAPKKGGLFLSLGLLRNQGIGFERILSVSLMVGAICSIIGVNIPCKPALSDDIYCDIPKSSSAS